MRGLSLLALAMAVSGSAAAAAPKDQVRAGSFFISPAGEPFRSGADGGEAVRLWVAQADADKDGALSLLELRADAARFFAKLDVNRDGEIDPAEMERYEQEVIPELHLYQRNVVRVIPRARLNGDGGLDVNLPPNVKKARIEGTEYPGLLNIPQPVASADSNFNRGISALEFDAAAAQRFARIDSNHDGLLKGDELVPGGVSSRR